MEKNLYCFRPSDEWRYCGGGLCIIASTFEEAVKLAKTDDPSNRLFQTEEEVKDYLNQGGDTFYIWSLVQVVPTYPDEESRIVLSDYNWG